MPPKTTKSPKNAPAAKPSGKSKKAAKGVRLSGTRNPTIAKGLKKYGSGAMKHKAGTWAIKNKKTTKKAAAAKKVVTKEVKGAKNGGKRVVAPKVAKWYPTEDLPKPLPSHKPKNSTTKLRPSLVPGAVLILLAGRFRGRRVVFLKQLESGLLLVTGPYKVNGVPLRRVNHRYVIGTSTRVNLAGGVDSKFDDAYFKKPAADKKKKTEGEFFNKEEAKAKVSATRVADQKAIDAQVLAAVKKVANLEAYLGARFSLSNNERPHELKF